MKVLSLLPLVDWLAPTMAACLSICACTPNSPSLTAPTAFDDIVKAAAADGQPALAITDLNNLFGAIKFYKEARGKGVKPLIGAEVMVQGLAKDPAQLSRMHRAGAGPPGLPEPVRAAGRAWTQNVVKARPCASPPGCRSWARA
jgi:hypothetical protein